MNQQTIKNHALALQLLGAEVEITENLVIAKNGRAHISFWISDKYGLFGWGRSRNGSVETVYSFRQIREALGLTDTLRSSVILIRALKALGLTNKGVGRDFRVHGEYNSAHERIRTIADLYGETSEATVVCHWDELKGALDMTGYSFKLHDCAGAFHYVSN